MIQHRNRTLRINLSEIVTNALAVSFLSADKASGSSSLTIKNTEGFSTGKYAWINPGGANSEIIAVHAVTSPTGNTLTLAANTAKDHIGGEKVYYVEFNQVEISHADTLTGTKTVLGTVALLAREKTQVYLDTTESSGFYFVRFKDSVADTFGEYSDGVEYDGWAENTVGYMIESALRSISVELSHKVTLYDCFHWINKGMREIKGKIRRWPEHAQFDYEIGQAQRGINVVALPSTIYDSETNRSIEAVRINQEPLLYLEPVDFEAQMDDAVSDDVRTEASIGATTLEVDNSYDFADSGTAKFYLNGTEYSFTYTGVTRSDTAGVLTGIPASGDGSITATVPVGTKIWQDAVEGKPRYYTVRNGALEIWPLPSSQYDDLNYYMDFNTVAATVDSEGDAIDYHRFGMLESYLTWRVWCKAENDGNLDKNNGFYAEYKEQLNDAIRTLPSQKMKTSPNINRMRRK